LAGECLGQAHALPGGLADVGVVQEPVDGCGGKGLWSFDTAAASLFFQLIASRYETGSVVVTSNLTFAGARLLATTSSLRPPSTDSDHDHLNLPRPAH